MHSFQVFTLRYNWWYAQEQTAKAGPNEIESTWESRGESWTEVYFSYHQCTVKWGESLSRLKLDKSEWESMTILQSWQTNENERWEFELSPTHFHLIWPWTNIDYELNHNTACVKVAHFAFSTVGQYCDEIHHHVSTCIAWWTMCKEVFLRLPSYFLNMIQIIYPLNMREFHSYSNTVFNL